MKAIEIVSAREREREELCSRSFITGIVRNGTLKSKFENIFNNSVQFSMIILDIIIINSFDK